MANKLFGTADPTLVRAAFMHGASNIPKDLSAVYKQREQNVKDFATGINEVFDKIYADDKATGDLLADVSAKSLKLMEAGGVVNDYRLTKHSDVINGYKQRLKDITSEYGMGKGGDLERSKLRSEMNTYLSTSQKDGETLTELTKAANNNVLLSDVGDNKKELLTLIIQDENNGTSVTKPEYIKGETYYSLPGTDVKMTMSELAEGFSIRNPGLLSNINKKLTNFVSKGKVSGKAMTEDDALRFKNEIQGSMSSWDEIRNVGQEKFGNMKFTFEEVLTGRATGADGNIDTDLIGHVYDELEKLGGADLDNDGDIDETDKSLLAKARQEGKLYTDAKNGHTLIDAIKKDKQLYRDVMANYLTETAVRDSYGQGLDQFKPKGGTSNADGGGENTYNLPKKIRIGKTIDGRYQNNMNDYAAEDLLNDVAAGTSFEFEEMNYSYVFGKDGGAWHRWGLTDAEQTPTEDTRVGSAADLETYVFKTRHPAFKNMVTEKEEGQTINKSGKVTKPEAVAFGAEDFMVSESVFTENINKKYDLSDYIIKDTRTKMQTELGFGESMLNAISVFDRKTGNLLGNFRTNYSNPTKAANALKTWNDFITEQGIKPKDPTAGMDNKQLIEYYKNNPEG